jgi:hypothetical protein
MLDKSRYKEKISALSESEVYEILHKGCTPQTEMILWKLLTKNKIFLPAASKETESLPW